MNEPHGLEDGIALLDRVLVEADTDGRPVSLRAVIVRICPTELWLGLASPDKRLVTMAAGMAVRLTVPRDEAALVSRSRFLRPLDGSKTRVFAVAWPGVLERIQRRAHVRYGFDWPIHFRRLEPATREPRGKAASGKTINISAGGLLFESDTPVEVDEEVALTLPLLGGDPVRMDGVVVRVRVADDEGSGPDGGHPRTEVAVKFTRITALDQQRLVRFVLLTEHRRREAVLGPLHVRSSEQAAATPPTVPGDDE